jgi:acyl-CoA thioesterase FadM
METKALLSAIDEEIARLTQARTLLAGNTNHVKVKPGTKKPRVLSPEARKRIADAQRKRWAAQRKAAK